MEYAVRDRREDKTFSKNFETARRYVESSEEPDGDNLPYEIFDLLRESRIGSYSFDNPERYVVGWEDEELVSMGSIQRTHRVPGLEESAVELYHLVVDEKHRGDGYGGETFDAVLDEALDMADEVGMDWLYMRVSSFSEPAQHLADEYGFEKVGETGISDLYACAIDELQR